MVIKGVVHQYCYDGKPFNLTACFIMKCDVKCYDYAHQNGGPWAVMYNNLQQCTGCTSFSDVSLGIQHQYLLVRSFIWVRRVKLNGQSETFPSMLAMGRY